MTILKEWLKGFNGKTIDYEENPEEFELTDQGLKEIYLNILPGQLPPSGSAHWDDIENWGWRLITTYEPARDCWKDWSEERAGDLYYYLKLNDLVISYNWVGFDSKILNLAGNTRHIGAFSMMDVIKEATGQRLKLQNLSNHNNFYGVRKDLSKFLNDNPTDEQCQAYNRNKIKSLNFLVTKAVKDKWLNYYSAGDDRRLEKLDTSNWAELLAGCRMPF